MAFMTSWVLAPGVRGGGLIGGRVPAAGFEVGCDAGDADAVEGAAGADGVDSSAAVESVARISTPPLTRLLETIRASGPSAIRT